ncbi:hypothetical protein FHW64_003566 [Variovorax sp. Sphag1AA]|nr:hypothetical protein [Variovorax sp. Sphag1AA]
MVVIALLARRELAVPPWIYLLLVWSASLLSLGWVSRGLG